ncbi:non-ribosomal peptide synthetase [Kribbella deserti]|uniref:Phenyloxazoline synthase MbtB n=1 Tax=Kribbella deserti TaxID=1926257 RepID=A0ABV6QFV1_9ACTN
MTTEEFIAELQGIGVQLWEESGQLRFRGPKGAMTPEWLAALKERKAEVLAALQAVRTTVVAAPEDRFEPFPLTDVQGAYLLGRNDAFGYGGVACHVYLEVGYAELDPDRTARAWNQLIQRHDMLRVVVSTDGYQQVLPTVEPLVIGAGSGAEELERVRADFGHRIYAPDQWPLFGLHVTQLADRAVLHLSMDFLVADWASLWMLLGEFETLHADPSATLAPLELTFRDYVLAERQLREGPRYQRDKQYWWDRVDSLPAAPELPLTEQVGAGFKRRFLRLGADEWAALGRHAQRRDLTPSSVVLSAYAATLERWSRTSAFTLNLTVLNRLPLHPQVQDVIGDFTSVSLLAVDLAAGKTFADRAALVSTRLYDDLDHRLCSGVEVLREVARRRGREAALMPIVFTSAIGLGGGVQGRFDGFGITQTPQVFIDCQAMDDADGLQVNWDVREGVFPPGLVDDMFATFENLLKALAAGDEAWETTEPLSLPEWQHTERAEANNTRGPLPTELLHHGVLVQAGKTPGAPAVIAGGITLTYAEVVAKAAGVAEALRQAGCAKGDHVAIVMDRGPEQVIAVLGTLLAGGIYLPIDTSQPTLRREAILADADVRHVLTQSWLEVPNAIAVDQLPSADPKDTPGDPDDPAYVIYTSGSTGKPKGAILSHRAAANTIADVNRRFGIAAGDVVLGLANLGFDLSVYDIFGPLGIGGTLVIPDADRRADPSHWADLIATYGVTVWNSVPALIQMLSTYAATEPADLSTLRVALLSGDWIPITLPDELTARVPGLEIIAMGGATEAAIWSNYHRYSGLRPGWKSIPYGVPLTNQAFHVLDPAGRDCPVWVPGELYISGAGLAQGYLGDDQTTAYRFVTHHDGTRLYRTGDVGRYLPGGEIEFLGREDNQVKLRGHRIELGEIEAALLDHPAVASAGVVVDGTSDDRALFAAVEPARLASPEPVDLNRMTAIVRTAADQAVGPVDAETVRSYTENLDQAVGAEMLAALQGLGLFATSNTAEEVVSADGIAPRFRWLVRRWLAVLVELGQLAYADGRYSPATRVDAGTAWAKAESEWSKGLGDPAFIAYLRSNTEALPGLLSGEQDPVALLFPEGRFDTADSLYRGNIAARYLNKAVATMMHRIAAVADRPRLRVLEAGAGTGGTTEGVVEVLRGFDVDYLFTDVSPFFLPQARGRYGDLGWIRYGVFDVDAEHRAQGIAPGSFDVILAAGVLENARDIDAALAGLTELLAPGGWLVITEPTREHPWILASQAFMMTEPGDSLRADGPSYLDRDGWLAALARVGAGEVISLPDDDHALAAQNLHLFAARFKADRALVTEEELLGFLGDRLPAHMIPSHLQVVDALPLTGNGKVDRRKLQTWRPTATGIDRATDQSEPMTELESKLATLWAAALSVGQVGRTESFFDLGADSLIMARMAGRLREELPEATSVPFDTLLRQLLNAPTIGALADFLTPGQLAPLQPGKKAEDSNAVLIPFGGASAGPLRVMFHAGLGTMECYRPLAAELVAQDRGPLIGVVINDTDVFCSLDPGAVIETAADDYTRRIVAEGHQQVQLIGYCLGGMYALEVARRLTEQGIEVVDLVLASSHPVAFDIGDDLMIETVFAPNIGLSAGQLGFGPVDGDAAVRGFMQAMERNGGRMPAGSLQEVGGDPELDQVGEFYRRMAAVTQPERFARYAQAATEIANKPMPAEMVAGMFRVFRQSFLSARFTPPPYFGDIRFLRPSEGSGFAPGMDEITLAFWREICLGEFTVTDVGGNHFSCVMPPHVARLAELIGTPLEESR